MHPNTKMESTWPEAGASLESEVGELIVLTSSRETEGETVEVEALCRPGLPGVEERSFDRHEIRFEVLEGILLVEVAGERRLLGAGDALTLTAGTPHRISAPDARSAARFIWQMRPAPETGDPFDLIFGTPVPSTSTQPTQPTQPEPRPEPTPGQGGAPC